jgi:hypothetical protein
MFNGMNRRSRLRIAAALLVLFALLSAAPATALDNPLTVRLTGTKSRLLDAAATIFDSGSAVLVDVTRYREILDGSAVTLNAGTCAKPGKIAFRLSPFKKFGSVTQLPHTSDVIYARARAMIIHLSADPASPAFACGLIVG